MRLLSLKQDGFALPALLTFMIAMGILSGAVLEVILNNLTIVQRNNQSQQAFNIAEAGVNYYLWHLSHNANDFKDGKTTPTTPDATLGYGPYVHDYVDSNFVNEGTFTLWIKPQGNGSTVATVRAIGKAANSNVTRTISAQIGAQSFASYAVLSDSALWFGPDESADGPVFSNQGVEMDGSSNSTVGSPNSTYIPPNGLHSSNYANGASHPGVWCDTAVTTPVNCNTRDKSNWLFPQAQIDFNVVSNSLCNIKKTAFASDAATSSLAGLSNACSQTPNTRTAAYIPQRSSSFNNSRGYLIELNPNGTTYNLWNVNNVKDAKITNYIDALTMQSVATNIPIPSSGVIFAEDNVWVRSNPTFHGRVTIANGRLATNYTTDITVADNLAYSTKNGEDAIGLVAEGNVFIGSFAPPDASNFTLEVDAAVLAETGSVEYPSNYTFSNTDCTRGWTSNNQRLNFYGSVATRDTWTWSWVRQSGCGDSVFDPTLPSPYTYLSGFKYNTTHYDYNLLYAPPPNYPVVGGYSFLSWREVLTKP
jgi:type II secretory pathway pseudopilin PulG